MHLKTGKRATEGRDGAQSIWLNVVVGILVAETGRTALHQALHCHNTGRAAAMSKERTESKSNRAGVGLV